MVLTDINLDARCRISKSSASIRAGCTEETYSLLDRVQRRYGKRITVYYPQAEHVESFVKKHGINGFYAGIDERLSCCYIRKVEPFRRGIAGRKAWITGVRREQIGASCPGEHDRVGRQQRSLQR